jgi:hypothetical protein
LLQGKGFWQTEQADELRNSGAQESLIQVQVKMYFESHVQGYKQAFLWFFVEGDVAY